MPVGQPADPTPEHVESVLKEVMQLLKEKHGVQAIADPAWQRNMLGCGFDYTTERNERNAKLKEAIFGLLQLESWESF